MSSKLLLDACPKCVNTRGVKGTLSLDDRFEDEDGKVILDYECVNCSTHVYQEQGQEDVRTKGYHPRG